MSLTRATVESILVKRLSGWLSAAGLAVTVVGTNADLNDPIGWAIRQLGLTVDDITAVDDTDVARVGSSDYDKLLDLAELRALETIQQNLDDVDIEVGPRSEKLDQLAGRVAKALDRKRAQVQRDYGHGLGTLEAGVITLSFMEQNETSDD
jgi:hypothetical protein